MAPARDPDCRGDRSWDEMMVGFFNPEFPAGMPVEGIFEHTVARN